METGGTEKNEKHPYEKPLLRVIELRAEEILGSCKLVNMGPGPFPPGSQCFQCASTFGGS